MRDLEEARRGARVDGGRERHAIRRPFDGEPMAAEHEEVEVELARPPALSLAAAGFALECLQCDEEIRGTDRGIRPRRDVEGCDRIQEVRLVRDADGFRAVQPGHATEASAGQSAERHDGVGQRSTRVTDVGPEPDVRPNPPRHGHLDRPPCTPGYSRRVQHVAVRILHPSSSPAAGELVRVLETARAANAEMLAHLFRSVGADDVRIEAGPPDGRSFGERLRGLIEGLGTEASAEAGANLADGTGLTGGRGVMGRGLTAGGGLVVLGSGSVPLLGRRGAGELVAVAGSGERRALANNRYSADVVAIGSAANLARVPDLPSDNALPRWLAEQAGYEVDELGRRWRLAIDIDSPLDILLIGGDLPSTDGGSDDVAGGDRAGRPAVRSLDVAGVVDRIDRVRRVAADPSAELVVAGRTSAATLRWLERSTASQTRALVEERGLRAAGLDADARPPRSVLGLVLDDRGPQALGDVLAELGDGAIVDSRVLLAHRLGADESGWPSPEDRFASDLLLADRIRDPWLRALTASVRDSTIPVLLGGHTLVGPGVRLLLGARR
jgi:hypothetical protein